MILLTPKQNINMCFEVFKETDVQYSFRFVMCFFRFYSKSYLRIINLLLNFDNMIKIKR